MSRHALPPPARYALYGLGLAGGAALLALAISRTATAVITTAQDARGLDNAWGGSQRVAERAVAPALAAGGYVTSRKRDDTATLMVGSTRGSDHHVGNLIAYAIDFGVKRDLAVGDRVFNAIRQTYGIPAVSGSYARHNITDGGEVFSIQLLWRVKDHFDHVHLGVRRVEGLALAGLRSVSASPMLGLL